MVHLYDAMRPRPTLAEPSEDEMAARLAMDLDEGWASDAYVDLLSDDEYTWVDEMIETLERETPCCADGAFAATVRTTGAPSPCLPKPGS